MSKLLAGRYELIEKIGEGGMAIVYKAKCRLLNRYVAIKILRPEYTKNAKFIESFKRESQAAAGLQHPNIISIYDVGREGSIYFIVMELVDGKPLSDIIAEKAPLDYRTAINITRQVASALSLAHKNHIIHRDVKPHNIMVTRDGTAKLGDFGIAKAISDSSFAGDTSKIIGSVHYFSPEQARGSYVDERSDIYSLGIVLYEMLTGKVPFDGDNPVQIALMHINDEITPPSRLVPGIPPALEKLVMKATDKFQSNRYHSADELIEDLDNIEFVAKMEENPVFAASRAEKTGKPASEREFSASSGGGKDHKNGGNGRKMIIGVVAGVIIAAAIIASIFIFGGSDKGISIPDLKYKTYDEAGDILNELGLNIEMGNEVPSKDVEKGRITSQSPGKGSRAKKGDIVTVNISSGNAKGNVPNLIGKIYDKESINALLEKYHYSLGNVTKEESDEKEGTIISQDPASGEEIEEGTPVDIVVSKGTSKLTVPNVIGYNVEDAKRTLIEAGFHPSISYEESAAFTKDRVMWQQFKEGERLEKDSTIEIKVSKGTGEIEPPPTPPTPPEGETEGGGGTSEPAD